MVESVQILCFGGVGEERRRKQKCGRKGRICIDEPSVVEGSLKVQLFWQMQR